MNWIKISERLPEKKGKAYLTLMKRTGVYSIAVWAPEIKEFRSSSFVGCQPDYWLEITGPEECCGCSEERGQGGIEQYHVYNMGCGSSYPIKGTYCPNCSREIKEITS